MYRLSVFAALLLTFSAQADPPAASASRAAAPRLDTELSRHCLRETGTRIKRKEGQCVAAPGTVVTREELERTGRADLGEALATSVPSLRLEQNMGR